MTDPLPLNNSIIAWLNKFNRKERFYLVGYALGNEEFKLSSTFRDKLSNKFDMNIPENSFVAMDYHLDWLYASLFLSVETNKEHHYHRSSNTITANQEDVDMIVAFEDGIHTNLLLLEAKGVMPFTNKQLHSKVKRFEYIFDDPVVKRANVKPYFAIMSPFEPSKIELSFFPPWMLKDGSLIWIELEHLKRKIDDGYLQKIVRCDDYKNPSNDGSRWMVKAEK